MQILDRQIAALLLDVVLHEVDLALRHDEPVTDVIAGWAPTVGPPGRKRARGDIGGPEDAHQFLALVARP